MLVMSSLVLAGCGALDVQQRGQPNAAVENRLLALLPDGQDAVFDVDVGGLRKFSASADLLALLPERSAALFAALAETPLEDLDAVVIGVAGLGTEGVSVSLIARGHPGEMHLRQALAGLGVPPGHSPDEVRVVEYHGARVLEADKPEATPEGMQTAVLAGCLLTPEVIAVGSRSAVRQAVDNLHGGHGAQGQQELMAALGHAPRARDGRPAVLMGLVPPVPLRDRLREADLSDLGGEARYVAAALAVGDGIDLGGQAGYGDFAAAQKVAGRLQERVAALGRRPALQLLGLGGLLDSFIFVAARSGPAKDQPEMHFAYRLPGADFAQALERINKLRALRGKFTRR